jgi:hypothetical protein
VISDAELAAADAHEVDDYARVRVTLRSGTPAWVYLCAREGRPAPRMPGLRASTAACRR